MAEHKWTGRLWVAARPTEDGRMIARGAVDLHPGRTPQLVAGGSDSDRSSVGRVDAVGEIGDIGVGVGTTRLDPGTYYVGIDLNEVEVEMGDDTQTLVRARLWAVTVYVDDSLTPAWPEAQILVHDG